MKVLVQSFCGIWSGNENLKKINDARQLFQNRPNIPIKVKPCFTDAHLVQKAYYYGQFALSLGKESPYTFSKFNLLNTDNLLIWTLSMAPLVSILKRLDYITLIHEYQWATMLE